MLPDDALLPLYVRVQLEAWGREFALHRDYEYLGHQSKNMLYVLIEHRGEMPGRVMGFKPLEVDLGALVVERIVTDIAKTQMAIACALRGYYCGRGRKRVERYEEALLLMEAAEIARKPSASGYLAMVRTGEQEIAHRLAD